MLADDPLSPWNILTFVMAWLQDHLLLACVGFVGVVLAMRIHKAITRPR